MNNVLIFGKATQERYLEAILMFDPEELKIFVSTEDYSEALEDSVQMLNLPLFSSYNLEKIQQIISFTDFIGLNQVMMLEDAVKSGKKVLFIPTK